MQGNFAKMQGQRRLIPAEGPRILMRCIGLSLMQGDHHSIAGKIDLETPRRCSLVTLTQLSSMSASGLLSDIDAWPADVAD